MKKTIFTILLLAFALSSVKAKNIYNCRLIIANGDSSFVYENDFYNVRWAYPLYEYSYMVKTNSGIIGAGVGDFTITLTNGTFSDNGKTELTVNENIPFKVKWNDITGNGVISISKANPHDSKEDTVIMGTPISFTYKLATLKGQTPNILLSSNPPMGNTQPVKISAWTDMVFNNIIMNSGYGFGVDLKVEDYYEWTLPSEWTANGKKGTFILTVYDSKNISIIPDLFTTGEIKVRAMNKLQSAGSDYKTFPINREFKFTSSPSITYGNKTAQTFSVTAVPGFIYNWSVPAGWQINGQGSTLEGLNLNSVSITPNFCSPITDVIKVRLKSGNSFSDWLNSPTQIAAPNISPNIVQIYQYEETTLSLQNIDVNEIQSVDFSSNVKKISNQGANYKVLFLDAGNLGVNVSILLKGCSTPITFNKLITVNPSRITISGPASVCPSSSVTYTASSNAPANFSWSCGPYITLASNSGNSATFSAISLGSTWVAINFMGIELKRQNLIIGNGSISITGADIVSSNSSELYYPSLLCTPTTATYYWELKDQSTQQVETGTSSQSRPYATLKPNSASYKSAYILKLTYEGLTCSKNVIILNGTLSLITLQIAFNMSPNPASSEVSIEITDNGDSQSSAKSNAASAVEPTYTVTIANTSGVMINKSHKKERKFKLSTSSLQNGIYNVTVSDGISTCQKKLIVKH